MGYFIIIYYVGKFKLFTFQHFNLFLHFKLIHEFNIFFYCFNVIICSMTLIATEMPAMVFSQQTRNIHTAFSSFPTAALLTY